MIVFPNEGKSLGGVVCKIPSASTNDAFTVLELVLESGAGAPLHVHHREAELFQVIEGSCTIQIEEDRLTVPAGTLAVFEKDQPHAFRNEGIAPVKVLITAIPGGLDRYFEALSLISEDDPDAVTQQVTAINRQYEIEFL